MITIADNDYLKVTVEENDTKHATLCFTGIGHAIGGVDIQSEEFRKSSKNSTAVFIVDKRRSWGNNIDFTELYHLIRPFVDNKTVNAIGNSMGGYLAILSSKFIDISSVVAMVPQWSVSKQIVPNEFRWDEYVSEIYNWRYLSLDGSFNSKTQYYIIAGIGGADDKHLKLFPTQSNVQKLYFTEDRFFHNVAQALKADGVLYDIIYECFSLHPVQDISTKILGNNYKFRHDLFGALASRNT